MNMNINSVIQILEQLTGGEVSGPYKASALLQLDIMQGRLRKNLKPEEYEAYESQLHYLCALMAVSAAESVDRAVSPLGLHSGQVYSKSADRLAGLREDMESLRAVLAPVLEDNFAFVGTGNDEGT